MSGNAYLKLAVLQVFTNEWQLFHNIYTLMIKKCGSSIMRTACLFRTSNFNLQGHSSRPAFPQHPLQINRAVNLPELPFKPSFPFSSRPADLQTDSASNYDSKFGRVNGFNGEQRVYFALISGVLLLLNVVARLSMEKQGSPGQGNTIDE